MNADAGEVRFESFASDYSKTIEDFDGSQKFFKLQQAFNQLLQKHQNALMSSFDDSVKAFESQGVLLRNLKGRDYVAVLANIKKSQPFSCAAVERVYWGSLERMNVAANGLILPGTDEVLLLALLWTSFRSTEELNDYNANCKHQPRGQ